MAEWTIPPEYHEGPARIYVPIERHPADFPLRACIVGYVLVSEVPIRAEGSDAPTHRSR